MVYSHDAKYPSSSVHYNVDLLQNKSTSIDEVDNQVVIPNYIGCHSSDESYIGDSPPNCKVFNLDHHDGIDK